jgi:carbonic anhydrase
MDVIYRYDPFAPLEQPKTPDAAAAIRHLVEGNDRFANIVRRMQLRTLGGDAGTPIVIPVSPISLGLPLFEGAIPAQAPFAVVVGCSDARVPTEAIFDQSFNDLFVLRIAGNVLGAEGLGSIHYALANLGASLKVVVVLGHSKCGAVTAGVDAYLSPEGYVDIAFTHALRSIVNQIQIAVRTSARALEERSGKPLAEISEYRSLLVAVSVYVNAAVSALALQREIDQRDAQGPRVYFGIYDFETVRVRGLPEDAQGDDSSGLRAAPTTSAELMAYASDVAAAFLSLDEEDRNRNCKLTVKW